MKPSCRHVIHLHTTQAEQTNQACPAFTRNPQRGYERDRYKENHDIEHAVTDGVSQEHTEKVGRIFATPSDASALHCWVPVLGDGIAGEKREEKEG
jgi:hypothetical protein